MAIQYLFVAAEINHKQVEIFGVLLYNIMQYKMKEVIL